MDTNIDIDYFWGNDYFDSCRVEGLKLEEGSVVNGKSFFSTDFVGCDFSKCNLRANTFRDCTFRDCNLSLAELDEGVMTDVVFRSCQLVGIDWTAMRWVKSGSKRRHRFALSFAECTLSHSVFVGMEMYRASFERCVAKEVYFENANLESALFAHTDLSGAVFHSTNLEGADLSTAENYSINPCMNRVRKTKFSLPEALSLIYQLDVVIVE